MAYIVDGNNKPKAETAEYRPSVHGTPQATMASSNPNSLYLGNNGVGSAAEMKANNDLINSSPEAARAELERAYTVYDNRRSVGESTNVQEAYIRKLEALTGYSRNNQTTPATTAPQNSTSNYDYEAARQSMIDSTNSQYDNFINEQTAAIQQALNNQIRNLQAAYQQAVLDGELSMSDAQAQYEAQARAIEQEAYNASERTKANAAVRGIQFSAQAEGMRASDNARVMQLNNVNVSDRDRRINDIKTRLNSISLQKELDIATAQSNAALETTRLASAAEQQRAAQLFGIDYNDYQMNREQQLALEQLAIQQGYNLQNMSTQQGYNLQNMSIQQGYNKENMAIQDGYARAMQNLQHTQNKEILSIQQANDLEKMKVGNQYDMAKLAQAHKNDVARMATQYGYDVNLLNKKQRADIEAAERSAQAEIEAEERKYQQAMQRELSKYTPGTTEYKIREGQLRAELDAKIAGIHTESVYKATATTITSDPALQLKVPTNKTFNKMSAREQADTVKWLTSVGNYVNFMESNGSAPDFSAVGTTREKYYKIYGDYMMTQTGSKKVGK